jgi:hypothetical protein
MPAIHPFDVRETGAMIRGLVEFLWRVELVELSFLHGISDAPLRRRFDRFGAVGRHRTAWSLL